MNNETKIELDRENFFNTKDYAKIEHDKVFIKGRRKDIIKIGDEIISLQYVENEIKKINFVEDTVCVDNHDDLYGSKIICLYAYMSSLSQVISKRQ